MPEDIRAEKKNITLYTGRTYTTPRVLMALEECGVEYDIVYVDLPAGDQRHPGFKELSCRCSFLCFFLRLPSRSLPPTLSSSSCPSSLPPVTPPPSSPSP